ncbi:hypothetical protein, partial [Streptomyces ipomoeae]|uniref:hypothetical protein n=1 Tax=Streptomyces ipomoeae TaxID=103232 RepID=UPI001C6762CB
MPSTVELPLPDHGFAEPEPVSEVAAIGFPDNRQQIRTAEICWDASQVGWSLRIKLKGVAEGSVQ